jgi:hypothetical protein
VEDRAVSLQKVSLTRGTVELVPGAAGSSGTSDRVAREGALGDVPSRAHTRRNGACASGPQTLGVRWSTDVVACWAWPASAVTWRMGWARRKTT